MSEDDDIVMMPSQYILSARSASRIYILWCHVLSLFVVRQLSSGRKNLLSSGRGQCNSRTLPAFRSVAVCQLISRLVSCALCMAGDLWSRIDRLSFGRLSSRDVSDLFAACTNRPCSRVAVTDGLVTVGRTCSCTRISVGELQTRQLEMSVDWMQSLSWYTWVSGVLKMIGKGFYRKWIKSSFEQFITTQTRVVAQMDE